MVVQIISKSSRPLKRLFSEFVNSFKLVISQAKKNAIVKRPAQR